MANSGKARSPNFLTPICRLGPSSQHCLSKGKLMKKGDNGQLIALSEAEKYRALLLIPKSKDISVIRKAIEDVKKAALARKARPKNKEFKDQCIKDGDEKTYIDKDGNEKVSDIFKDHWMINVTSTNMPVAMDIDGSLIATKEKGLIGDPEKLYPGCYVIARIVAFEFDHPIGGPGVSLGFDGIKKVADGLAFFGGNSTDTQSALNDLDADTKKEIEEMQQKAAGSDLKEELFD